MAAPVDDELVEALARAAGVELPAEDRELLSMLLKNQLDAVRVLEAADVEGIEPIVSFDPRWR